MESPRIAILGAGPVGLEAALAASERGFSFKLYETAPHVGGNIRQWGHVRLFTPWETNVSLRMRHHLEAAGAGVPSGDTCPTGDELVDRVLTPVAALPEIAPYLRLSTRVIAVGRSRLLKHESIGTTERAERPFRLVLRDASGRESTQEADIVLDCTGTYGTPNALGNGGIPAPGETAHEELILRHIPNVAAETSAWEGKSILVVGAGHSAQTAICDLAAFAQYHPGTTVVWLLRSEEPEWRIDPDDPLPERSRLTARAAEIARVGSPGVETLTGFVVDAVERSGDRLIVDLARQDGSIEHRAFDIVLSLTGYIGDAGLYRQLQVHECYATSGPMKLAAALLGQESADCLDQVSHGPETLTNPEPNFYLLGVKSYGRTTSFLMQIGYSQVDEVFSLIPSSAARDRSSTG